MSNEDFLVTAANLGVKDSTQLARADWLRVAVKLLAEEGVDSLRITKLAEVLGVTRGSFYWHFKNREELLDTLVIYWQQKNASLVPTVLKDMNSLNEGVVALFAAWLDPSRFEPRLDVMIRDWGRKSSKVKKIVTRADIECIEAIAHFFHKMGMSTVEAMTRARTMYFCQIGYYVLDLQESLSQRLQYWDDTLHMIIGSSIDTNEISYLAKKYDIFI